MTAPDVRVGDVWRDGYPSGVERVVMVERLCSDWVCLRGRAGGGRNGPEHAHVIASPSGRSSVISLRRFRPGKRGYSLVHRGGESGG